MPDYCPTEAGNSTADEIHGCVDGDGDGIADFLQTAENSTGSEENNTGSEENENNSGGDGGLGEGNTEDGETTDDDGYSQIEYIIGSIIAAIILVMLLYTPFRIRRLKKRLKEHEYTSEKWEELDFDGDGEISDKEFAAYKYRGRR